MTYDRKTPSRKQLFDAYKQGIDLNFYVRVKQIYKHHNATMAIVAADIKDLRMIDEAIKKGIMLNDIGDVYLEGIDLKGYFSCMINHREDLTTSHSQAVEACHAGIASSYALMRYYGLPHEVIIMFSNELAPAERKYLVTYIQARSRGISIEDTKALLTDIFHPYDFIPKMLDAGVTPAEIIGASRLDGPETMVINMRHSYAHLRTEAHEGEYKVSHQQAIEVVSGDYIVGKYLDARKRSLSHTKALAASKYVPYKKQRRPSVRSKTPQTSLTRY